MRTHLLNLVLLIALFAGSAWVWRDLPDPLPAQFDAAGRVTRWEESTLLNWFLLPLIALATVALNYAIAASAERRPGMLNVPEKRTLLELPPERRAPVMALVRTFLYQLSTALLLLMGFIQLTRYRTALGADPAPYVAAGLVFGVLLAPLVFLLWLPPIQREIRRQADEWELDRLRTGG